MRRIRRPPRYLAAFLSAHRHVALDDVEVKPGHDTARPDIVLFNGGLFESSVLRDRVLDVLTGWFRRNDPTWRPLVLDNDRLDLAVARGAAYYGMVRRGQGVRIAAGLARTYYIGVESEPPSAVCLVPAGVEPGQDVELASPSFNLLVSQPVEFPLFISSTRLVDRPGEVLPIDREQMTPLPPIRTVLKTSKKGEGDTITVNLHARLTEIGTLDLWCSQSDGRRSWRLQFDVRSATQTDAVAHESAAEQEGFVDEAVWHRCAELIDNTFGPAGADKPEGLAKRLAEATGASRNQWPTSLLRRIGDALGDCEPGRRKSPIHEARWLNLLGFALRPGYGVGAGRLARERDVAAFAGEPGPPRADVPGRVVDPLAADRRRTGGRPAAGLGRTALGTLARSPSPVGPPAAAVAASSASARTRRPKCGGSSAPWNY